MAISQKCQYAVRALLELAKQHGRAVLQTDEIAARQAIPPRFLGNILNELRAAGLVAARRGPRGGFLLACDPRELTVGRVIRLIDGPLDPVRCVKGPEQADCPLKDRCSLVRLWDDAKSAVEAVYDGATFAELARQEAELDRQQTADYCI
ncbi:MAG: Rrf2 family transcriptional regulator [Phycisphaerae bacterium]